MTKRTFLIFVTIVLSFKVHGQGDAEILKVAENIERVFHSESGQLILDLKQIPESILKRLEFIHDSIDNVHLNSYGSKPKEEMHRKWNEMTKSNKFIAGKSDKWRAGDVITEENTHLPTRRFLIAISDGKEIVFAYWHGGIGLHLHIFYIHLDNVDKLTGFIGNNGETFRKYERKEKLDKIRTANLTKLVDIEYLSLRVFRGRVVYPVDQL